VALERLRTSEGYPCTIAAVDFASDTEALGARMALLHVLA